jgi:hypothetical protein
MSSKFLTTRGLVIYVAIAFLNTLLHTLSSLFNIRIRTATEASCSDINILARLLAGSANGPSELIRLTCV